MILRHKPDEQPASRVRNLKYRFILQLGLTQQRRQRAIAPVIAQLSAASSHVLWTYNNERPNMGIGGITPAQKLKMAARILLGSPVTIGGIT